MGIQPRTSEEALLVLHPLPLVLFLPHPLFLFDLSFPPFLLLCLMSSLPPRNLLSPHHTTVLALLPFPYARGLPCFIPPAPTAVSLFLWSVPFLPQSWLGLALGSPDFLESRPFLPSCPFSLSMKTKIFELEMAFKHLPRDGGLPGNPGIALSDFYHFFPKRKTFVSSPAG